MRRLACLIILTLLTGCPDPPQKSLQDPPATDGTTETTPDKTDAPDTADPPKGPEGLDTSNEAENALGTMAMGKDPVCGMDVDLNKAAATHVWGDETYVFCNTSCAERFKKDPKKFVK